MSFICTKKQAGTMTPMAGTGHARSPDRQQMADKESLKTSSTLEDSAFQVWTDQEHGKAFILQTEVFGPIDARFSRICQKEQRADRMSNHLSFIENKENIDPTSFPNQGCIPCPWLPRSPLQDITILIQTLKAPDSVNKARVPSSISELIEASRRNKMRKGSDAMTSQMIQIR
ncbi:hypothetical protein KP509_06G054500 [Ceratopteris richardii]|uniref:Uncharacterized protein n=1 Tax=Ceratopteris richardii TaxID=49495 RepID=A0A8T2UP96_CERRI|nr:hypothetical protein KP509_06G054500 [Ceratopteris richardii]